MSPRWTLPLEAPRLVAATRLLCAITVVVLVVERMGVRATAWLGMALLALCLAAFLLSLGRLIPEAHGPRRRILIALTAAAGGALLAQIASAFYLLFDLPARFPTIDLVLLLAGAHPALIVGYAAAFGYRRRGVHGDDVIDTLLLVAAAMIVGIVLGSAGGTELDPAHASNATFLFFWRWLPMTELLLVAFLLAEQGSRLGLRTAAGVAFGTVSFSIALMIHGRLAMQAPATAVADTHPMWAVTLLLFTIALDRGPDAGELGSSSAENRIAGEEDTDPLELGDIRGRFVVVAMLIAAAATITLGFQPPRGPELAIAVATFGLLLAARTWRELRRRRREARELALSVTAERAVADVLEHRVTERTRELAEAQRVLQRMWVLGQQITLELNPTRVLQRFVEAAVDIAHADGGVLALVVDESHARVVAATGMGEVMLDQQFPLDSSAIGHVIRTGKPWFTGDTETEHPAVYRPLHDLVQPPPRSMMIIPLHRRGETNGGISIASLTPQRFGPVDVERVTALTDILSVALSNAELVETLRKAEWRFRTLFRSAPDAVLSVLSSGRIREANDAIRNLVGLDPVQVVGRFVTDFVADEDRPRMAEMLEGAFAGRPTRLEVRLTPADGSALRMVDIAASRLPEAEPPAVLIIARDISEEREMRMRLMETERLAAVGELVAGVAHEVNNPLSSISAFAQLMLRDGGLSESQRESIDVIRAEAVRASQVVRDLLAFARRSDPQHDPVDLNTVVDRSLRLRAFELSSNRVHLEPSLALDIPPVMGDARQLQQVVLNLITNAIQAMAATGGGTLTVATRGEDANVILEIADTGPGIPPDARARIFEPFYTTKEEGQGTGLGLSVSYGIVRAHGGTIELADTSELGTRFVVTLPAAPGVGPMPPEVESAPPSLRSPLSGVRILFADDEAALRTGIETYGRLRGFEVLTAADGVDALRLIRATGFDALVCDVRMPELDGPGLHEIVRRERPGLAARTLFITGDMISAAGPLAALRQPVLTKPFTFERLEEMLVGLLRGQGVTTANA